MSIARTAISEIFEAPPRAVSRPHDVAASRFHPAAASESPLDSSRAGAYDAVALKGRTALFKHEVGRVRSLGNERDSAGTPCAEIGRGAFAAVILALAILWMAHGAFAQNGEVYKVRLSPVPLDQGMLATVAGSGSLTAVLSGKTLKISGTFAGLKSPAIAAQIHHGPKAVRGPVILDVPVPNAASGTISASIDLTAEQVEDLRNSSLYIQINSQGAPAGNLWGWFLREKP
jgi:hypothetical protein